MQSSNRCSSRELLRRCETLEPGSDAKLALHSVPQFLQMYLSRLAQIVICLEAEQSRLLQSFSLLIKWLFLAIDSKKTPRSEATSSSYLFYPTHRLKHKDFYLLSDLIKKQIVVFKKASKVLFSFTSYLCGFLLKLKVNRRQLK